MVNGPMGWLYRREGARRRWTSRRQGRRRLDADQRVYLRRTGGWVGLRRGLVRGGSGRGQCMTAAMLTITAKDRSRRCTGFSTDDVAQRLTHLVDTLIPILLSDEVLVRTAGRVYVDTWLENRRQLNRRRSQATPERAGRRTRWIETALKPIRDQLR